MKQNLFFICIKHFNAFGGGIAAVNIFFINKAE